MRAALDQLRPLLRTRQYRQFTDEPISDDHLLALTEVARWSGSSRNSQPWRFIVTREESVIRELWRTGVPQLRSLETATAIIAISMPDDERRAHSYSYDEGRAAERMLIAAAMLGFGAAIAWVRADVREQAGRLLNVPDGRFVRTIMAIGQPTEAERAPRLPAGQARLPADELISWR